MKAEAETNPSPNHLDKLPIALKKGLDKNLCTCMDVPMMDIVNAVVDGAATLEDVQKQTYAATGAGCCIQQVERLIDCLRAPEPRRRRRKRTSGKRAK